MKFALSVVKSATGGIAFRLGVILLLLGAMTGLAVLVGQWILKETIDDVANFGEMRLPDLRKNSDLVISTYDLKDGVSAVLLAADTEELQSRFSGVLGQLELLEQAAAGTETDALATALAQVRSDIERFRDLRAIEFQSRAQLAAALADLDTRATALSQDLTALADRGHDILRTRVEQTITDIDISLQSIIDNDVAGLRMLLRMQADINLLSGTAIALSETTDPFLITSLQDISAISLARLEAMLVHLSRNPAINLDRSQIGQTLELFKDVLASGGLIDLQRRDAVPKARESSQTVIAVAVADALMKLQQSRAEATAANSETIRSLLVGEVANLRDLALLDASLKSLVAAGFAIAAAGDGSQLAAATARQETASAGFVRNRGAVGDALAPMVDALLAASDSGKGISSLRSQVITLQTDVLNASQQADASVRQVVQIATDLGSEARAQIETTSQALMAKTERAATWMAQIAIGSLLFFVLASGITQFTVIRPVRQLCRTTERLASGDHGPVGHSTRQAGEIGRMARGLTVFRDNLVRKIEMEQEEEARQLRERAFAEAAEAERMARDEETARQVRDQARVEAEREASEREERRMLRAQADAERRNRMQEQEALVLALATGLTQLAEGNLDSAITDPFPDAYEALRHDFNAAIANLSHVIRQIAASTGTIDGSSAEMSAAAEDLAKRTEHTAATLQETSGALDHLTNSVASAARSAQMAHKTACDAKDRAVEGTEVVEQTARAMANIEKSSEKIARITGVIEDIAFQTNLLALNAGVEAARAGDAGRGFAVVATEVRALAQRSSEAAKEISTLIAEAETNVQMGSDLVSRTGGALESIAETVTKATAMVEDIAESAQTQAQGVSEINNSVTEIDQVTQRNAALFEETNALVLVLEKESAALAEAVRGFRLPQQADVAADATSNTRAGVKRTEPESTLYLRNAS